MQPTPDGRRVGGAVTSTMTTSGGNRARRSSTSTGQPSPPPRGGVALPTLAAPLSAPPFNPSTKILAIGPNPAYQRALTFHHFTLDGLNRASSIKVGLGGKGVQFAKVLHYFCPGRVILAQFIGGYTGDYIEKTLNEMGVQQVNVKTNSSTRICTTLICKHTKQETEVIDPPGFVLPEEVTQLESKINEVLPMVSGIALCGTYPYGVPKEFYANIIQKKKEDTVVLLEGFYPGIEEVLNTKKVNILKIKEKDLGLLTNTTTMNDGVRTLKEDYNVQCVLIGENQPKLYSTNHAHLFWCLYDHYELTLPDLTEKFKEKHHNNHVGFGDTVTAIFLVKFLESNDPVAAYRYGLAAGCARYLETNTDNFSLEDASKLYDEITVTQWT